MLHDAIHDNLTGLPNRELFFDRLDAALDPGAGRAADAPTPAALAIDIDRFKEVNDCARHVVRRFGAADGGAAARRAISSPATRWRGSAATSSARSCCSTTPSAELAAHASTPLRAMLASPISFGDREIALTVSIGVARLDPALHTKGGDLLADAEIALANAKKAGGDRAEIFAPGMRATRSNRQIARKRPAPRARARRDQGAVPADRPARGPHGRRLRGAAALAPSAARACWDAADFSSLAEVERRARRHRRLRDRDDGARTRRLAEGARGDAADLRQRQRLVAPDAEPRSAQRRARRAQPPLRAARHAEARNSPRAW